MRLSFLKFGRNNEERRLAWLKRALSQVVPNSRLLDAGAGELRNKAFCSHLTYVSQDFCQYEGKGDGAALQTGKWDTSRIDLVSDITAIPAPDASFDVVLCTEVLEHVPDPLAALRELARLVRPGGTAIITAPFCSLTHFAPYHYASGLSKYWFEKHLAELGFTFVEATPNGGWLDFVAQEVWRLPLIGRTYSSRALGWLALPLLCVMRLMKAGDHGSSELLTLGWHVVARKP
jgi:ubiquinone/menaquinone biosynthesis C-methylase UbiE